MEINEGMLSLKQICNDLINSGIDAKIEGDDLRPNEIPSYEYVIAHFQNAEVAIFFKFMLEHEPIIRLRGTVVSGSESPSLNEERINKLIAMENQNATAFGAFSFTKAGHGLTIEYVLPYKHSTTSLVTAATTLMAARIAQLRLDIEESRGKRHSYWRP